MKRVKTHISILLSIMVALCFSAVPTFAEPAESSSGIDISEVKSISETVPAADNDKYLEVDLNSGEVTTSGNEVVDDGFNKIYGEEFSESGLGDKSKSGKAECIRELTSETDGYTLESTDGKTAQLSSRYATCRLMVKGYTDIETFGATKQGVLGDAIILRYSDEEATAKAYGSLCSKYGSENVLVDLPVKTDSSNWSYEYMNLASSSEAVDTYGRDITVAVIDTGLESAHKVFKGKTILKGYNFIEGNTDTSDYNGHGTYVSSVIAQATGSNIKILPIKVMDDNGDGSLFDIACGVEYAALVDADVVNMSISGDLIGDPSDQDEINQAINWESILGNYLADFNGPIIAAAGNSREDLNKYYTWPAVSEQTLTVSALQYSNGNASFAAGYSNYGNGVDYCAPGSGVYMADFNSTTTYSYGSGTSFAAPHVSAAAAIAMSDDSTLNTSDQVEAKLDSMSEDLGNPGKDVYYGKGCPHPENYYSRINISGADINTVGDKVYTGSAIKPKMTVKYGDSTLVSGTDYTVTYGTNKNVGKGKVTIKGIGEYSGTREISFKILPKKTSISKLTKGTKAITVKWSKQSAKMSVSRITGYQIQVATNSKFTTNSKKLYVSGYSKTSKKVTSLKAKKKYYVRVRTYKTVSGTKYYSSWSDVSTVKTK